MGFVPRDHGLKKTFVTSLLVWTALVALAGAYHHHFHTERYLELGRHEAEMHLKRDTALRMWASSHGGVYVPVDSTTAPNPYLSVPHRELETELGTLTLMNPAYIVRQLNESYGHLYGIEGQLCSDRPLNPVNAADPWEAEVLAAFETGVEQAEYVDTATGEPVLRVMRPFRTKEACLKCHAHQGYQVGDLRGAISVKVPLSVYKHTSVVEDRQAAVALVMAWLLVGAGIVAALNRQDDANHAREESRGELLASRTSLDLALSGSRLGRWDWNPATDEAAYDDRWLEMLGYARGDIAESGEGWTGLLHPDDVEQAWTRLRAHLEGRSELYEAEFRARHRDGSWRWFLSRGRVAERDGTGAAVRMVGTQEDITDRIRKREAEAEMLRRAKTTHHLESLGVLAGGIAHDFNNILQVIAGNADFLAEEADDPAAVRSLAENINRAGRQAADICSQMLTYAGGTTARQEVVDLCDVIRDVARLLRSGTHHEAELELDLPTDPVHIRGDRRQLLQVVLNLATNAVESYGPDRTGRVLVRCGIETHEGSWDPDGRGVETLPGGDYCRVDVSDQGAGMGSDEVRRVREPFFTTKFQGRGMGLPLVEGIARSHGGAIAISSQPGSGTTVTFFMPAAAGSAEPGRVPRPLEAWAAADHPRVLVVEDEPEIRAACSRYLERRGFYVITAGGCAEALRSIRGMAGPLAALVTDVSMPDGDGMDLLADVRALFPGLPAVVVTGLAAQEVEERLRGMDNVTLVTKPFAMPELVHALREQLAAT